ncbi:putative DNA-binding transcriptional regulator [Buttiauxella agrestis]|uniref:Putative DNA-binding transcriptional regulator n=1 Tax=Buttiauxella agrestis TaxID=82977 RepID=A0A381C7C5_9ENTR|nr:helix-turn-helix domain-containing protein [Buttiauxella agrestis]SUW63732.1 putative DNA-binding transcriptional regulator [Buttiauxella agrestis]
MPIDKFSPHAGELINKLSPFVTFQLYSSGHNFPFEKNGIRQCYLVRQGRVSFYRNKEILIGNMQAPILFGLGEFKTSIYMFIQTNEPCEIAELPRTELFEIVAKNNLWELMTHQMEFISRLLMYYANTVNAPTAYELICIQLKLLMNEPETVRETVPAEKYIRSKTLLSRSGVMRILGELKKGEYILMEDGILKEIKHLPAKY